MEQLRFGQSTIETVVIRPTKQMPLELFKQCHRLAYYMELMERVDHNHVVWDESVTSIYTDTAAEAEYLALQNGWFVMDMELPKNFVMKYLPSRKTGAQR